MSSKTKSKGKKSTAVAVLTKPQLATAVKGQISDVSKIQKEIGFIHDLSLIPESEVYSERGETLVDENRDLRARLDQIESRLGTDGDLYKILSRLDKRATNIKPSLKKHLAK